MKFISNIINAVFLLLLFSVIGLFTLPYLPIEHDVELRIVQSGSMEPAISTGSLILVWPQTTYGVGDVIMFEDRNASVPTTHRIVDTVEDVGVTRFVTQGDANEDPDNASVVSDDIYGAVAFSLPKAGFVLDFARQPLGFVLLIMLPALLLIIGEIEKIWRELRRRPEEVVQVEEEVVAVPAIDSVPTQPVNTPAVKRQKMMDIMTPVRFQLNYTLDLRGAKLTLAPRKTSIFTPATLAVIVGAIGITSTVLITQYFEFGSTYSYYNDTEVSEYNSLTAIALDFSAVADGEVYTFENGDLVADDDGSVVTMVMPVASSEPTRHNVSVEYVSGNQLFCDAIEAASDEPVPFAGSLTSLNGTDIIFDVPWSIGLTLPDETGLLNGDTCNVDILLSAWHIDEENGEGYFDEERVSLSFNLISPVAIPAGFTSALFVEETPALTKSEIDEDTPSSSDQKDTETTGIVEKENEPETETERNTEDEKEIEDEAKDTEEDSKETPLENEEAETEEDNLETGEGEEKEDEEANNLTKKEEEVDESEEESGTEEELDETEEDNENESEEVEEIESEEEEVSSESEVVEDTDTN